MTKIGDVIQQIETLKYDPQYPLTTDQKATFNRILRDVYLETTVFNGRR